MEELRLAIKQYLESREKLQDCLSNVEINKAANSADSAALLSIINDSFFEVIGYLSDWGDCCSGTFDCFDYYRQKTSDEFKITAKEELTKRFIKNPNVRTKMTVDKIDKEFSCRI